jgi:hypothetical protein
LKIISGADRKPLSDLDRATPVKRNEIKRRPNCLHPGFVASRIGNKGGFYDIAWALLKSLAISPEEGATTSLYVAAAPEMAGITGQFLIANKPARSNAQSYDLAACERLWKGSAKMTGVDT